MFVRYLNYCTSESGQVVRIIAGVLVWLAVLIMRLPEPTGRQWGEMLLLLATLLLVPLSFRWFVPLAYGWHGWLWRGLHGLQLPAALSLVVAYKCFASGIWALVTAIPWCLELVLLASFSLGTLANPGCRTWLNWCLAIGASFSVIGGVWMLCDRIGYRPMDFEADIVLLTAIHFHYAGYLLPTIAGLMVSDKPALWTKFSAIGTLTGVPLVAAGITTTHLLGHAWLESIAAVFLSLVGLLMAMGHLLAAYRHRQERWAAALLGFAGLALAPAMVLAALYGVRFHATVHTLDIPQMRKWHGTFAALGFAAPALLGWRKLRASREREDADVNTC